MALDLSGAALKFDAQLLLDSVDEVQQRGWKSLLHDGIGLTLIRAGEPVRSSEESATSVYARLEAQGVLCVAGSVANAFLDLSGGSVSTCRLDLSDGPRVVKHVARSAVDDVDGLERHIAEAQWMEAMNDAYPGLFPNVEASRSNGTLRIRSKFFPAYTLGELFIQNRLSPEAAKTLVARAFARTGATLFHHPSDRAQESYLEKVDRRLNRLLELNELNPMLTALYFRGGCIDDNECRPIEDLLALLASNTTLWSIINNGRPRLCHGDFIPEDILYSVARDELKFVDPNPQIRDPLADIGKMVMSCAVNYDLALRDHARVRSELRSSGFSVETSIDGDWTNYSDLQSSLMEWILQNVSLLACPGTIEEHRLTAPAVRLFAGLQAMALPVFHSLHHGNAERALYFLARGHVMTEKAIRDLTS